MGWRVSSYSRAIAQRRKCAAPFGCSHQRSVCLFVSVERLSGACVFFFAVAQLAEQQQARARDDNGAAERVLQQFEAAAAAYPEVLSTPPRVPREYPAYLESTLEYLRVP